MDALCSYSILSCDRLLVVLDEAQGNGAITRQVKDAARQGKPMDVYLTPSHCLPGDAEDPWMREIAELIARSGGVVALSLDELRLVCVRKFGEVR